MKISSKCSKPISTEELSKGYCKSFYNAVRLIEDGGILLRNDRFLSALNCFRLGLEELAKAHLVINASTFNESDEEKWEWFWKAFSDHKEKGRILEYELHWKSDSDKNKFHDIVNSLIEQRLESIYVQFDERNEKFLSPEDFFRDSEGLRRFVQNEFNYVKNVLRFFNLAGMPDPNTMLKVMDSLKKNI